jgi:hypothetical protein
MSIIVTTAYLPPASYMAEVLRTDEVVVEVIETYRKQTIRNHCAVYGPNGRQILSIPVVKVNGNHTRTKDIRISDHQPWQRTHWRSIETAYNNSPFFLYYQDLFAPFYEKRFRYLIDLNFEIFQVLLQILAIGRTVRLTEEFEKSPSISKDLRTMPCTKNPGHDLNYPKYTQVFEFRHGFIPGLSIIDVIFNLGPEASIYLDSLNRTRSG